MAIGPIPDSSWGIPPLRDVDEEGSPLRKCKWKKNHPGKRGWRLGSISHPRSSWGPAKLT
jgi:hypothetical protein